MIILVGVLSFMFGGILGVAIMCLLQVGSAADEMYIERDKLVK